ncbi:hypothetical protein Acr_14g0009510 [Actinidia rufa]|uniref:Uncharacterized protein n=1 Tax=Actinidia rufa TaxID=165716 RepID=A0A7J0FRI1_9ERIC|nr:hypothetical protein Acr_14g0009510 [Actinidia rufa]
MLQISANIRYLLPPLQPFPSSLTHLRQPQLPSPPYPEASKAATASSHYNSRAQTSATLPTPPCNPPDQNLYYTAAKPLRERERGLNGVAWGFKGDGSGGWRWQQRAVVGGAGGRWCDGGRGWFWEY